VAQGDHIKNALYPTGHEIERALLVAVESTSKREGWTAQDSLQELAHLASTAGAEVVASEWQRLSKPTSTYYVGKGKLQELVGLKASLDFNLVMADDELSPRQQRTLEAEFDMRVIDRTALILDIFAHQAQTREGKLQVELAQHRYLLPRLVGRWEHLERLGGGIGTRGPGESQLETDRRLIRQRIRKLEQELDAVGRHREVYRSRRRKGGTPLIALVGYTNAGKSTLFNLLSKADVTAENRLFSTLDPVTRRVRLPDGASALMTDTVGFIHKLPPSIVAAFRTTLEELGDADVLLHVLDITDAHAAQQYATVEQILGEIGLGDKPTVTALNKVDLLENDMSSEEVASTRERLNLNRADFVPVSAVTGWGVDALLDQIARTLEADRDPTL